MEKIKYKREIRALKKHRKSYVKKLEELYALSNVQEAQKNLSMEYTAENGMLDILELIDTGFLRADAFDIKTYFGDYRAVYYYGADPFTEKGITFLLESRRARNVRYAGGIIAVVLLLILIIALLTL